MKRYAAIACVLFGMTLACKPARIMDKDETNLVGKNRMGIEGYERLIDEAMRNLLSQEGLRKRPEEGARVIAYMGLKNETNEPHTGSDILLASERKISSLLTNSGLYRVVPRNLIKVAMKEVGITDQDRLMLPAPKKQFLDVLSKNAVKPQYFLYVTVSSATTEGHTGRQKNYYFNFQIVDAGSGTVFAEVFTQDKSFRKYYRWST